MCVLLKLPLATIVFTLYWLTRLQTGRGRTLHISYMMILLDENKNKTKKEVTERLLNV